MNAAPLPRIARDKINRRIADGLPADGPYAYIGADMNGDGHRIDVRNADHEQIAYFGTWAGLAVAADLAAERGATFIIVD